VQKLTKTFSCRSPIFALEEKRVHLWTENRTNRWRVRHRHSTPLPNSTTFTIVHLRSKIRRERTHAPWHQLMQRACVCKCQPPFFPPRALVFSQNKTKNIVVFSSSSSTRWLLRRNEVDKEIHFPSSSPRHPKSRTSLTTKPRTLLVFTSRTSASLLTCSKPDFLAEMNLK
jgi:hypothetical protein